MEGFIERSMAYIACFPKDFRMAFTMMSLASKFAFERCWTVERLRVGLLKSLSKVGVWFTVATMLETCG